WLNNNVFGRFTVLGVESRVIIPPIRRLLLPGPPKNGHFSVGDVIDNSLPQSGSFMGWVCVEAGSPGIWKGFGKIDE
ncbi:hypothetical protein, partial [Clostridium perfringens]